jgi:hypothetical protein
VKKYVSEPEGYSLANLVMGLSTCEGKPTSWGVSGLHEQERGEGRAPPSQVQISTSVDCGGWKCSQVQPGANIAVDRPREARVSSACVRRYEPRKLIQGEALDSATRRK